jgi:uncharacterized protein (DUF4415 family)
MKRQPKGKKRVRAGKKASRKKAISLKASARRSKISHSGKEWTPDMAGFFKPLKKPITLRLDADVLAWFKGDGRGYQTRINQALRKIMTDERKRK